MTNIASETPAPDTAAADERFDDVARALGAHAVSMTRRADEAILLRRRHLPDQPVADGAAEPAR